MQELQQESEHSFSSDDVVNDTVEFFNDLELAHFDGQSVDAENNKESEEFCESEKVNKWEACESDEVNNDENFEELLEVEMEQLLDEYMWKCQALREKKRLD